MAFVAARLGPRAVARSVPRCVVARALSSPPAVDEEAAKAAALKEAERLAAEEAEKVAALKEVERLVAENNRSVTPDHVYDVPDGLGPGLPEDPREVTTLDGQPALQRARTVVISQKAQSAMTSVGHKSKAWVLHWKVEERWSNPLMGWTSTADPLSNLELKFETPDQAVDFATKNGWNYELHDPIEHRTAFGETKYAHNFLAKLAEYEVKVHGKKVTRFDFAKPNSSHYFRPLTYHGDAECRQHGLNPDIPWK